MSNVRRVEVGLVSRDHALVEFYAEVFGLDAAPPEVFPGSGTLHRLASPGGMMPGVMLKVMVPVEPAAPAERVSLLHAPGLRYLTIWVDDFDGVLGRFTGKGGTLVHGPIEYGEHSRLAVLADPDGNSIEVVEAVD
jgi:predicted enzyme related to lactoylglutathione lyase